MKKRMLSVLLSLLLVTPMFSAIPAAADSPSYWTTDAVARADSLDLIPCANSNVNANTTAETNILVAYFSATGNTKTLAEYTSDILSADLYEIKPQVPYTSADLNYNDNSSRSSREQNDSSSRPVISGSVANMEKYDVVFLGYPIWWGQAPKIISTFLEKYDFSGKTIIPFCTSGGSGIGSSATNLQKLCADSTTCLPGSRFGSSTSRSDMEKWINGLELKEKEVDDMIDVRLSIGNAIFSAKLYDNETTRALIAEFPMTLNMTDLHSNEKYYNFSETLPGKQTEKPASMNAGDIMLWQGNCLVLFYKTFANSYGGYDRLGYVEDVTGYAAALGSGNVEITFSLSSFGEVPSTGVPDLAGTTVAMFVFVVISASLWVCILCRKLSRGKNV